MADPLHKTSVRDVEELDELLSEPTEAAIRTLAAIDGDIVILGVGGKMGPTLARMAKRASDLAGVSRRIIGVSRFSSSNVLDQPRSRPEARVESQPSQRAMSMGSRLFLVAAPSNRIR